MKTISFEPSTKQSFELLYQGLVYTQRPLDRGEVRVHSRILGKLEAIGKPDKITGTEQSTFTLGDKGGVVELEDAEYELANKCLDSVPFNTQMSRPVGVMLEMWEAAGGGDK